MIKPNEAEEFEAGWYDAPAAPGEAEQDEFDRLIASAPTAADRRSTRCWRRPNGGNLT